MPQASVEHVDVVILGAGSAGLAALRDIRKRTESFLLVNDGPWGTTCARVGCMPSKTLIAAADAFHARTKLEAFGIRGGAALSIDGPAVMRRVRALRDEFVAGALKATEGLGARAIAGRARLLGPTRVAIGARQVEARAIIVAVGSRPVVPAAWRALGPRVVTTDEIFELPDLPKRAAVVGLGAIGVEIAQALARLGVDVAGYDAIDRIAGLTDPEVTRTLRAALEAEFPITTGTEAALAATADGVEIRAGATRREVDLVVAAIGRRPNVAGLGLETLGVPLDARGLPAVDPATMRVGDLPVFLTGDAGGAGLLHEAADDGHAAALNALAETPVRLTRRTPFAVVFCDPCVAVVGARAADLNPDAVVVGEASFARQGRARTAQRNLGLIRLRAGRVDGRILSVEMAAPAAEHIGHLLALAIDRGLTVHDLLRLPFYHPTLEEGLRTALRSAARQLPPCGPSDLAGCAPFEVEALD